MTLEEQSRFVKALEEYKVPQGRNNYKLQLLIEPYSGMRMGEINSLGLVFFDNNKNDIIDTGQVNSFFYRLMEKAGISKRGQHALRHTFATRCIEAGVASVVLKNWLGHKDIHITLDTYAYVFSNMHNDAMEKLEEHVENIFSNKEEV
ncbi:MAG: tyrosine-type recombinase/integrase [Clostridiales bacterium]|nr:tyrosine-type recombinase/integrase [Clostridiales bacterium]